MQLEIEQKYPLADSAALLATLKQLGAERQGVVTQADTYYNHPSRDFAATDEALRIRRTDAGSFVTYKGPKLDAETKTRREIELPLTQCDDSPGQDSPGQDWPELFAALGFRKVATVSKTRESYTVGRGEFVVEICIDRVDRVGDFAELEIVADEERLEAAKRVLAELEAALNLAQPQRRSYLEMLLAAERA